MCIDNTTALAYIGNMGGKLPALNELARKIWLWCIDKNIWLSVAYIETENNVEADNESRLNHDNLEWNLNRTLFDEITKLFYMPDIDIFASRLNNQLEKYISWRPDPFAIATDALSVDWSHLNVYAIPPFSLIGRVLLKIEQDQINSILSVVPYWTTQVWFSKLSRMLISCPFLLPRHRRTLLHPCKTSEDLPKMQLMVCRLSTIAPKAMDFRQQLSNWSCRHGEIPRLNSIKHTLKNGLHIVVKKTLIPCHHMSVML